MTFKNYKLRTVTTIQGITPSTYPCTVIGLSIANTGASTATANAYVTNGTNTYIVKNISIPLGCAQVVVGGEQKLVLVTGDVVNIVSDIAVDVIMSVLE